MLSWIRFSCSFETSSDKLHNVSQSVSQSVWAVLRRPQSVLRNMSTLCWGAVKVGNIFWIFDFHKVATYCSWGGNLCDVYIENFPTNHLDLVEEFWKSIHICQSYYSTSNSLLFWNTVYFVFIMFNYSVAVMYMRKQKVRVAYRIRISFVIKDLKSIVVIQLTKSTKTNWIKQTNLILLASCTLLASWSIFKQKQSHLDFETKTRLSRRSGVPSYLEMHVLTQKKKQPNWTKIPDAKSTTDRKIVCLLVKYYLPAAL